jgi:hypothetical protein
VTAALTAGAAVADITPAVGVRMGGYGARTGVAEDVHDALHARALVLDDGSTRLAIVVCDLVGVMADLVAEARSIIASDTGIPPECVLVSATHTHSGPGTIGIGTGRHTSHYVAETARRIAGAVAMADRRRVPVTLKVATVGVTTISQNRRHPDGPIETEAVVLLVAPEGNGPAVATVVNYACHSTVLEADNLHFSADFPGAMARLLERSVGGVGIYLQGAAGDINPAWMSHDFREVERVGGILGAAATRAAHELRPVGGEQWVVNLNWSELTAKEPAPGTVLSDVSLGAWRTTIDLPRRALPGPDELATEIRELEESLAALPAEAVDERRARTARLNELRMTWVVSSRMAAGKLASTETMELQVLRLSPTCVVVSLPGEFFVETGRELRERVGLPHVLVAGYANGYVSYVPPATQFPEAGYEVGCAQFPPDTAERLVQALAEGAASVLAG